MKKILMGIVGLFVVFQVEARLPIEPLQREIQIRYIHTSQTVEEGGHVLFLAKIPRNSARRLVWPPTPCSEVPPSYPPDVFYGEELLPEEALYLVRDIQGKIEAVELWTFYVEMDANYVTTPVSRPTFLDTVCTVENYAAQFAAAQSFVAGLETVRSRPVIDTSASVLHHAAYELPEGNSLEEVAERQAWHAARFQVVVESATGGDGAGLFPSSDPYYGYPLHTGFIWDYRYWGSPHDWAAHVDFYGEPVELNTNALHFTQMAYANRFTFLQPGSSDIWHENTELLVWVDPLGSGICRPTGFSSGDMGHLVHYATLQRGEESELRTTIADIPVIPNPVEGPASRVWGWSLNTNETYTVVSLDYKPVADSVGGCASCLTHPGGVQGSLNSMHYSIGLGSTTNGTLAGVLELGAKEAADGIAELSRLRLHALCDEVQAGYSNNVLASVTTPQCKVLLFELPDPASGFVADFYYREDSSYLFSTNSERTLVVAQDLESESVAEAWAARDFSSLWAPNFKAVHIYELCRGAVVKHTQIGPPEFIPTFAAGGDLSAFLGVKWEMKEDNAWGGYSSTYQQETDEGSNTITRAKSGGPYGAAEQTVETHVDTPWGWALVRVEEGLGWDDPLWKEYTYYTNAVDNGYGKVELAMHSDGNWERHEYHADGSLHKTISPFGDPPPEVGESLCRVRETVSVLAGSERTTTDIEWVLGVEVSRSYTVRSALKTKHVQCASVGGGINDPGNLVTTTIYIQNPNDDSPFTGKRLAKIEHSDGTLTLKSYPDVWSETTWHGEPNGGGTAVVDGTRTEIQRNSFGHVVVRETTDIASSVLTASELMIDFDEKGKPIEWLYLDGTTRRTPFACCCGIESETASDGSTRFFEYDPEGRITSTTYDNAEGVSITERLSYDAAGNLRKRGYRDNGMDIWLELFAYDSSGRLRSSENAEGGETVHTEGSNGVYQVKTTTNPDGGTMIEEFHVDGQLHQRTGTAAPHVRMEYGVENGELFSKEIQLGNGGETTLWSKTLSDFLGRPYKTLHSDGSFEKTWHNANGQVEKTIDRDGITTLYTYTGKGERETVALDRNGNGSIDYNGMDRIVKTTSDVVAAHGIYVRRTTTQIWDVDNADTPRITTMRDVSIDGLQAWNMVEGQETHAITTYTPAQAMREDTTTHPDGTQLISTTINGQVSYQQWKDSTGATVRTLDPVYGDFARLVQQIDSRNGTTAFGYYASGLLASRTRVSRTDSEDTLFESYGYDTSMRPTSTTRPDGTVAHTTYDSNGQVKKQYGAGIYPIEYSYDVQGRKTTLTTWHDYAGSSGAAITTWIYNPTSGYLARNQYNDGKGTDYTYTPGGKIETRTWERGSTTTYNYDVLGNLDDVDYSDNTPDIDYTYDRLGRVKTVGNSNASHVYIYTTGLLTSEAVTMGGNTDTFTRTYDALNRSSGLSVDDASSFVAQYGYDETGRFSSLTSSVYSVSSVVQYSRDPATGLPTGHTAGLEGSAPSLTVEKTHDGFNRLAAITNTASAGVSSYTYTHNALGQRTSMAMDFGSQGFDSIWHYEYDSLGQLENAWKTANGETVPGRQSGYEFDDIGNRLKTTRGNNTSDLVLQSDPIVESEYTPSLLNQYSQRTVPAYAEISGTADSDAVLSFMNEDTGSHLRAGRNAEWFHTFMPLENNSASAVLNTIRMTGVLPAQGTGGNDLINTNQTLNLTSMKTPEVFVYDDDGNLLSDGRFNYGWNAENRLIAVSNQTGVVASYAYDYLGRRISKTVGSETTTFLWNGNHIIHEESSIKTNTYSWGQNDHLVSAVLGGTNVFYAHDGNKNVTDLVDGSGNGVAHYEFDPYGKINVKTSELADANPFRFSNEYYDLETGHVAYMLRYLKTITGSWLNRDPIEEQGGMNLYGFVGNNPVSNIDQLGLYTLKDAAKSLRNRGVERDLSGSARDYLTDNVSHSLRYTKKQIFDEWYRLEANNQYFWFVLPKCPRKLCKEDDKYVRPNKDRNLWTKPKKKKKGTAEVNLHPGLVWSMRSIELNGSSNQCAYDDDGVLLPNAPGAGTVDFKASGFRNHFSIPHWDHDVRPIYVANQLDGGATSPDITYYPKVRNHAGSHVRMYYERRPLYAEKEDGYQ